MPFHSFRSFRLLASLFLVLAHICSAQTAPQSFPTSRGTELLRDPNFSNGVTQGYANHLKPAERKDCLSRWTAKGITNAQWAFWEISEQLYFAQNPTTPSLPRPGTFLWSTENKAKQCQIENGTVRFHFDTSKEWREGGKLNLPDKNGVQPRYGDPNTTWPHFLIGQHLTGDNKAAALIPDANKLDFNRYEQLRFGIEIRLNHLLKSSTWNHRAEYGAKNHAIFYIAFIIMPKTSKRVSDGGKFYMLVPAIYSEGANRHVPSSTPWLGLDQHGDGVYFSGAYPTLKAGEWVSYDIDVKQLIRDGFAAASKRAQATGLERTYRPEDYFVTCLLVGWEVWGGFDTDVEFKNLSLRGIN